MRMLLLAVLMFPLPVGAFAQKPPPLTPEQREKLKDRDALLRAADNLFTAGKLKALAVSSLTRIASVPDVPTLDELGFKGFESVSWHMVVVPTGTPNEIVNKLNKEFKAIVAQPDVQQAIVKMGLISNDTAPPDELKRYLDAEIERWGKLVRQVGIAGTE